jgi:hypothetical protein
MSNLFLRAALAGCATAAAAVAQTQPVPPPIAVPVPVPTATFVARVASPAQGKMILKTVEVGDLVCPPADGPLAKPGTDPAMQAAAKAFTEVRAEELMKAVKTGTDRGWWDEYGGGGKLAVTTDGKSLVVNHTAAVVDKVEACVGSIRKLRTSQVKVDVILFTVPSKNEAVAKLFGDKQHAAVKADEMKLLLRELKASGQADILSRPTLLMVNKQTGFCQVGEAVAMPNECGTLTAMPMGVTTRVTPDVSADLKSVALAFEYEHRQAFGGPLPGFNSQVGKANVVLPDGGTMAVRLSTFKVEQKSEYKVPVVGDLPYVGRLFTNIGVSQVPTDTVAVITATRVHDSPAVASPVMNWAVTPPMMPTAAPVPVMLPLPGPSSTPFNTPVALPPARPQPPALVFPHPVPVTRTVGPDGLERVGVHFDTLTTTTLPKATGGVQMTAPAGATVVRFTAPLLESSVAGGCIGTAIGRTTYDFKFANDAVVPVAGRACDVDPSDVLMKAYKAACAAGKKEEAARLALQLLVEDPTCFGK